MMVVEAVMSFTIFLMVVLAVISLINIFILHNKIQFAMNSAAREMASYSYLYQVLGIRAAEEQLDKDGGKYTEPIDNTATQVVDTINKIQSFSTSAGQTVEQLKELEVSPETVNEAYQSALQTWDAGQQLANSGAKSVQQITDLCSDPQSLLAGIIYMGASAASYEVKSAGAKAAAGVLVKKYIGKDADNILKGYGIKDGTAGLDFSGSTMFCDNGKDDKRQMIDIIVQYDVDMGFLRFVVPKDVHVVQRVTVAGWLDGDGTKVQ